MSLVRDWLRSRLLRREVRVADQRYAGSSVGSKRCQACGIADGTVERCPECGHDLCAECTEGDHGA